MTPVHVSQKKNENLVYKNLYGDLTYSKLKAPKFSVGDLVCILKSQKGFKNRWTKEIYKIHEILNTQPVTYRIIDLMRDSVKRKFLRRRDAKDINPYFE